MARLELEKVVAAQALEATKGVLQHLQNWAVQLEQRREQKPRELAQHYGQVRRIRDYLARSIAAPVHPVELDLDDDDCNLLASCCVFALQGIGMQLRYARDMVPSDRAWLEEKRDSLSDLVLALATEEIKIVPSPGGPKPLVPLVRILMNDVRKRTRSGVPCADDEPEEITESKDEPKEETKIQTGGWTGAWSGKRNPLPGEDAGSATDEEPAMPELGTQDANMADVGGADIDRRQVDRSEPERRTRVRRAMDKPQDDLESLESSVREEEPEGGLVLNAKMVRDPRLRAMLVLDARALERARLAKDYRLSAVHLCSVFESVVVDVALVRRVELDLKGTPETWKLDDLIRVLLGQRFSSSDRAGLYHLVACRNLIRPSIQLHNPIVVTQGTLAQMIDFVQRMLIEMGVSGSATGTRAT